MNGEGMNGSALDLGRKVFSGFEGNVSEDDGCISISSTNMIKGKRVECRVMVRLLDCREFPFCVDGEESTNSTIGGCGSPCSSIEEVERELEYIMTLYNFRHKRQMSLFDF